MEYCCHVWAGADQIHLNCLDKVQRRVRGLIGEDLFSTLQPHSHQRDVSSLSLFYRYYHGDCSEELHSLVPPAKTIPVRTLLAATTEKHHPHSLQVPKATSKFHQESFFPRTVREWNKLPTECFPQSYNLDTFKTRVNSHLLNSPHFS